MNKDSFTGSGRFYEPDDQTTISGKHRKKKNGTIVQVRGSHEMVGEIKDRLRKMGFVEGDRVE